MELTLSPTVYPAVNRTVRSKDANQNNVATETSVSVKKVVSAEGISNTVATAVLMWDC